MESNRLDDEIGIVIGSTGSRVISIALRDPFLVKNGSFVKIMHFEENELDSVPVIAKVQKIIRNSQLFSSELSTSFLNRGISSIPTTFHESVVATVEIVGYLDQNSKRIKMPRRPIKPGIKVFPISHDDISFFFETTSDDTLYIGRLIGYDDLHNKIPINLSVNELISEHFAILAMTGAGKSYTVGRICEQIVTKFNGTVLILDPHGEYGNMFKSGILRYEKKKCNDSEYDDERVGIQSEFQKLTQNQAGLLVVTPENTSSILKYGAGNFIPLVLNLDDLLFSDIGLLLPDLTEPQRRVLDVAWDIWMKEESYPRDPQILINLLSKDYDKLKMKMESETIVLGINARSASIVGLRLRNIIYNYNLFYIPDTGNKPMSLSDILGNHPMRSKRDQFGRMIVLDYQNLPKEIIQTATSILLTQLLRLAKSGSIRSSLIIAEEGHIFAPSNQNIGTKSILAQIAAEGRKFGIGLGIISQRPSKLDPDVVSQCNTFFILRIKNPEDQQFVRKVAEYVSEGDLDELPALNVGESLIFGRAIFSPIIVNIGPRHLSHGGETPDITAIWRERYE